MYTAHINDNKKQTCEEHSRNTALNAGERLKHIGLYNTAYLAGLLHDAGKFTDEFNEYISAAVNNEKVKRGSVIHSFAGCSYILEKFFSADNTYRKLTAEIISYAIGAHHGFFDIVSENNENGFEHRKKRQPQFDKTAISHLFEECTSKKETEELFDKAAEEIEDCICKILDELSKMADAGEISDEIYDTELDFYLGLLARLVLSAVIEGDRTDTYNFMSGNYPYSLKQDADTEKIWDVLADNADKYIHTKENTTPVQKARGELSDICRDFSKNPTDIYELKMPTGAGKTLSGLRLALYHAKQYKKHRIIYIAPLISILEQNADVIKKAVGDASIVLEHHSNIISEEDVSEENNTDKTKLLTQTWDAPIIVTTLVQFLNTLFGGKTSQVRRFSALENSIVILDEVQSVPWKMLSLFDLAVNFLNRVCGTTVFLCSATQPSFGELKHKMLISSVSMLSDEQEKRYSAVFKRSSILNGGNYRLEQLPEYISEICRDSKSTLVICNKKSESEYLYNKLKTDEFVMVHLSASMCMKHREEMLDRLYNALNDGRNVLCIATQVIEAGVDVSFDTVIRFKAGLDNVVQANGRCNRHGVSENNCKTYVVDCTDESLIYLKEIQRAKNAMTSLLCLYETEPEKIENDLASSAAVKHYYSVLFNDISKTENYCDYPIKGKPSLLELLSSNEEWRTKYDSESQYTLGQAFKTAGNIFEPLDSCTISVLVPYGDGKRIINDLGSVRAEHDVAFVKKVLQEAKHYTVSIMRPHVDKLIKQGAVYKIYNNSVYVLNEDYYSVETGLILRKEDDGCSILIL